jgi:hypothetical protein
MEWRSYTKPPITRDLSNGKIMMRTPRMKVTTLGAVGRISNMRIGTTRMMVTIMGSVSSTAVDTT